MAKKNIIASTSRPKKPKLPEILEIHSNLRRSSHQMVHRIEFSNTANDPIEVEEMGNLFESNEQGSTFGEEALNEEDSRDISNALVLADMTEDFLDEKTIATREGLSHPHPYKRQVCRPPHRNPHPLLPTTRESCEAKPCCLLKTRIKIFLF